MGSFNKFITGVAVGAIAATIIKNNKEAIAASLEKAAAFVKGFADRAADEPDEPEAQEQESEQRSGE